MVKKKKARLDLVLTSLSHSSSFIYLWRECDIVDQGLASPHPHFGLELASEIQFLHWLNIARPHLLARAIVSLW